MKLMGFVLGAAAVSLSIQHAQGAAVSGTSAPAYQEEAQQTSTLFPTGAPNTVRIHRSAARETRGVYEFALPTLPNGGSYTSVNLGYYVAESTYPGGGSSALSFSGFAGNGRFDAADSNPGSFLDNSGSITTFGPRSESFNIGNVNSISNSKSPWLGVMAQQSNLDSTTGVSRRAPGPAAGGPGPIPSLSYTAIVPNAGTLSTRAMVDALATASGATYTLNESGSSINTQETTSGTNRRGILEFNLGGLPSGATLTSATLKFDLNVFSRSTTDGVNFEYANPRVFGYNGDGIATVTDASQIGNLLATGSDVTASGDYSIALGPADVQALLGTNNIAGMLIRSSDGQQFSFYTSDSTLVNNVPVTLDVTYAIPEPASLAAVVFAAGALLTRHRRGKKC